MLFGVKQLLATTMLIAAGGDSLDTYQHLIEAVPVANRVFVNSSGDDVSGDGTEASPYKTYNHVRDNVSIAGKTLILENELYSISWEVDYPGHQSRVIGNSCANVDMIGRGGTIIECVDALPTNGSTFFSANGGTFNAYGIHFRRGGHSDTTNHECSICSNGGGSSTSTYPTTTMTFNNCIIEDVGGGNVSLSYMANVNSYTFNNCSFITPEWVTSYSGSSYVTLNNCAFNRTPILGSATSNNNIFDVTFDADWKIIDAHGVAAGANKWGDKAAWQAEVDAFANVYHVSLDGDDATGDGSLANPFLTIHHAKAQASPGDLVLCGSGTFLHNSEYDYAGTWNKFTAIFGQDFSGISVFGQFDGSTTIRQIDSYTSATYHFYFNVSESGGHVSKFKYLRLQRDTHGTTTGYRCALQANAIDGGGWYGTPRLECDGCTFEEIGTNSASSSAYANSNAGQVHYKNCNFNIADWYSNYSGSGGVTFENCIFSADDYYIVGTNQINNTHSSNIFTFGPYNEYFGPYSGFYSFGGWDGKGKFLFDGADDFIEVAANADFALGTGDFSLYARMSFNTTVEQYLFGPGGRGGTSGFSHGWGVRYSPSRGLCFFMPAGADGGAGQEAYAAWAPAIGQEHAILITRNSGVIKIYIDGLNLAVTQDIMPDDIGCTLNFRIGHSANSNGSHDLNGSVQELNIIKGVALTPSSFSLEENSGKHANTVLLLQAQSAQNPTSFNDLSESAHNLTLSGDVILAA